LRFLQLTVIAVVLHMRQLAEKTKQNCKNRRLTSRGSPFSVTVTWVAGEARAKGLLANVARFAIKVAVTL